MLCFRMNFKNVSRRLPSPATLLRTNCISCKAGNNKSPSSFRRDAKTESVSQIAYISSACCSNEFFDEFFFCNRWWHRSCQRWSIGNQLSGILHGWRGGLDLGWRRAWIRGCVGNSCPACVQRFIASAKRNKVSYIDLLKRYHLNCVVWSLLSLAMCQTQHTK